MKNVSVILGVIAIAAILQSNVMNINSIEENNFRTSKIEMPEDIKTIVDKSCYGCHNKESRSEKGKEKLKWDALDEISKAYDEKNNPVYAAARLWVDEVIDPAETRKYISMALEVANNNPDIPKFNPGVIQT